MSGPMIPRWTIGRRTIAFTNHARDRYYERTQAHTVQDLERDLEGAEWSRTEPNWMVLSTWHRGRTEGFLKLDDDRCFVVVRNTSRELVAVSFMQNEPRG